MSSQNLILINELSSTRRCLKEFISSTDNGYSRKIVLFLDNESIFFKKKSEALRIKYIVYFKVYYVLCSFNIVKVNSYYHLVQYGSFP